MRYIFVFICVLTISFLHAQCDCTNCDLSIPTFGSTDSEITITGATNPTLGQNGQDLRAVNINMIHDAIDELTISLVAPDGSTIMLTQETGFSTSQNMTFDICFLACGETAEPDPGFPAIFDSDSPYQSNQTYMGSYYPADNPMCFEDLTGPVNGIWRLEINDGVPLDGGTLIDWSLDFYDNDGTTCTSNECGTSCLADGGEINGNSDTLCVGDPALNFNLPPTYSGSAPDPALYDYTYVIYDNTTGIIIAYDPNSDLTSFAPGEYVICGLSYLISDFPLIPNPDGTYDIQTLQQDIDNNEFCADLSASGDCQTVVIQETPETPIVNGPDTVCENEVVTYIISNFNPGLTYNVIFNQGTFTTININGDQIELGMSNGPAEFCVEAVNSCGTSDQTCLTVEVIPEQAPVMIMGPDLVCPNQIDTYTISPPLGPGQSYDIQITGGTLISQNGNILEIEWFQSGSNTLTVDIIGGACDVASGSITVNLDLYTFPPSLNSPAEACIGDTLSSFINPDPDIINYLWSGNNAILIPQPDPNEIRYVPLSSGQVEICLEVETDCGFFGPECETIIINDNPDPVITPPGFICGLNFPMSVQVQGGFDDLNWTSISGPGNLTFSPDNTANTQVTASEPGVYNITVTATQNNCTGADTIEIQIGELPDTTNFNIDCDLNGNYTISFDIVGGMAPYSVNGNTSGNTFISPPISSGDSYNFEIVDDNGCSFTLSGMFDCPCISDAGTMASALLEACLDDSEVVTATANGDEILDNDDLGLFYLHDGNGNILGTIFDQNATGTFSFVPGMIPGETYFISFVVGNDDNGSIDLNDPCLSVAPGQPVIFYENPTLSINGDLFSCESTFTLSAQVSGNTNMLSWSQVAGPGQSTFTDPDRALTIVTVSEPGLYTYQLEGANPACDEVLTFDFTIFEPIVANVLSSDCISSNEYILEFNISGGSGNYTIDIPGTLNGSIFTSEPLNTALTYSITITDDNDCSTTFEFGPVSCNCFTEAGSMSANLIEVCINSDSILFELIQNATLENDDTSGYVIHTGAGNFIDGLIGYFPNLSIAIPDTLDPNTIYYFSQVAGNELNGVVDLNDPCLDVAQGQPFRLIPLPDFSLADSTIECGLSAATSILNSNNPGSVEILSDTSGTGLRFSINNNEILWQANSEVSLTYSYTESNTLCTRTDTFSLQLLGGPQIINFETSCLGDSFTYSFNITGGTAPYLFNGIPLNGSSFNSNPLSTDSVFTLLIEDSNGCSAAPIQVDVDCSCINESGMLQNPLIALCNGQNIDLQLLDWTDSILESTDTSLFLLFNGPDPASANVVAQENAGFINYDNFSLLDTFYIFIATADQVNGDLDFNDPCLDFSNGIPVIWYPNNQVDVSGTFEACAGDSITIPIAASGDFPFTFTLNSDQGRSASFTIDSPDTNITLEVGVDQETWTVTDISGICTSSEFASFILIGQSPVVVQFNTPDSICNDPAFGSTLDLNTLLSDNYQGEWSSSNVPINGTLADFAGLTEGTYTFTFSTIGFEDPCPGNTFTVDVQVIGCECPQVSLPANLDLCTIEEFFDLNQLGVSLQGSWSIINTNALPVPPRINGTRLEFGNASEGSYQLTFALSGNFPSNCSTDFTSTVNLFNLRSSGEQIEFPVLCSNQDITLDLNTILEGADENGTWTYDGQVIDAVINALDYEEGQQIFTYTLPSNGPCPSNQTDVIVDIDGAPNYSISQTDVSCFNFSNGSIEIISEEEDFDLWMFTLNGQPISNRVNGLDAGDYILLIENSASCRETETITITQPQELTVDLGPDQTARRNSVIPIDAIVSIDSNNINNINWIINGSPTSINNLSFDYEIDGNTLFEISIEDTSGCTANDQKRVNIIDDPIYIPNVFRPNSDIRDNARFGIEGNPNTMIKSFKIFDRWGNMMFEVENVLAGSEESYWDGRSGQKRAHTGVYVYSIEIELPNGNTRYLKGDVTLIP